MPVARFVFLLLSPASATWTIQRRDANNQRQECTTSGDDGYLCCSASQSGTLTPTTLCLDTGSKRVTMDAGSFGYYKISVFADGSYYLGYFTTTAERSHWPLSGVVEEVTGSIAGWPESYTLCHSGSQCCNGAQIEHGCTAEQLGQSDAVTMTPFQLGGILPYAVTALGVTSNPHPGASYGSTHYGVTMDNSYNTFVQGTGGPFSNEVIYIYSNSNRVAAANLTNITLV